jgi:hypothetical protein
MKPAAHCFGRLNDQKIRGAAAIRREGSLRSGTARRNGGDSKFQRAIVRGADALIFALLHDQNAGVRLKVMQGLTPFAQHPEVRAAMTQVLLTDTNPGLRTQAIDLLTKGLSQDNPA